MEATISVRPHELTEDFFRHIKSLAENAGSVEIKFNPIEEEWSEDENERAKQNWLSDEELLRRKKAFDDGEGVISFTMPELEEHIKQQMAGA